MVPITLADGTVRALPAIWALRMPSGRLRALLLASDDGAAITVEVDADTWEKCATAPVESE